MGKIGDVELGLEIVGGGGGGGGSGGPCLATIGGAISFRCVLVLALAVGVFLSAFVWMPFSRVRDFEFVSRDPDVLEAGIQAGIVLEKPVSFVATQMERLEYDIFEEIGVPNSKVSIVSMHCLASTNTTYVIFAVLPDPKNASINLLALSVLRSSLVDMVLHRLNLSLTASIFGYPTCVELLRFTGGVTVIPVQSASIWQTTQVLFDFGLNYSIFQLLNNLDELKEQLEFGLDLRYNENVYVELTNEIGSTVASPTIVETSVLTDGTNNLLPDRLRQLAEVITGPQTKNLGLNHSVFGRVKGVQLSSYFKQSISVAPTPSPSPCPFPNASPSPSPLPDLICLDCKLSPSGSVMLHAPFPRSATEPPHLFMHSPGPSATATPDNDDPCISPVFSPNSAPKVQPPPSPNHLTYSAVGPTSEIAPNISPSSPTFRKPSPLQKKGTSGPTMSPSFAPFPNSHAVSSTYLNFWLVGLLGAFVVHNLL